MDANTNQQQSNQTTMSLGAVLEMLLSLFVLFSLFIPTCSLSLGFSISGLPGGDIEGGTRMFSFYNLGAERDNVWHYVVFALPVVNFIVKIFRRTSWLSALTLYSAVQPILLADEIAGDGLLFYSEVGLGYYVAWFNIIGISTSVFISWLVYLGRKIKNYKLLFILSLIFVILASVVVFLYDRAIYVSDEELRGMMIAFGSCAIFAVINLTMAFISLGANYKRKKRADVEDTPVMKSTNESEVFEK